MAVSKTSSSASKPASRPKPAAKPAASKTSAPRSNAPSRSASKPAANAASKPASAPKADSVAKPTQDKGSTASTQKSANNVVKGMVKNFSASSTPNAAPNANKAEANAKPTNEAQSAAASQAATAAQPAAQNPAPAATNSPAQSLEIDMTKHTQARLDHTAARINDPKTTGAERKDLLREQAELRGQQRTQTAPPPAQPEQRSPEAVASRRESGVDPKLEQHSGGPPAAPFTGKLDRDKDGNIRTGTIKNEASGDRHHYITQNALPPGLTKAQAEKAFRRFNAPTNEAQRGLGNEPNVGGVTKGSVDPTAPLGIPSKNRTEPVRPFGFDATQTGGNVELRQGNTKDGRPWAVNTTIDGEHPLKGHVTRTLVNEPGKDGKDRYYIRTEGVGHGNDHALGARHRLNQLVGPPTFNNLDNLASEYANKNR